MSRALLAHFDQATVETLHTTSLRKGICEPDLV